MDLRSGIEGARVSLSGVYSFLINEAKEEGSLSVLQLSYGSDLQERTEGAYHLHSGAI